MLVAPPDGTARCCDGAFLLEAASKDAFFVFHDSHGFFHGLNFVVAGGSASIGIGTRPVVLLVVVSLTLVFEFLGFDELFDLVHICQPFRSEKLQLHNCFLEEALFEDAVDQVVVFIG